MPDTVQSVTNAIARHHKHVQQTLQRCRDLPYPSAGRSAKIEELLEEASRVAERAQVSMRRLVATARASHDELTAELKIKQTELAEQQQEIQAAQQRYKRERRDHQLRVQDVRARGGSTAPPSEAKWKKVTEEYEREITEKTERLQELQQEIPTLQSRVQLAQQTLETATASARESPAPEDLLEALQEMRDSLDRAGALEKEIAEGNFTVLATKATGEFKANAEDFRKAERHHGKHALGMLAAMGVVTALLLAAVWTMFMPPVLNRGEHDFASRPSHPATIASDVAAQEDTVVRVERIAVLATGRLAVLFFFAWALRFFAELHRAHSEQAIMYRDRAAALGVAELLFEAAPDIGQRRDLLRSLSTVYLTVGASALSSREGTSEKVLPTFDSQIKSLRKIVESVRPLVELVGRQKSG